MTGEQKLDKTGTSILSRNFLQAAVIVESGSFRQAQSIRSAFHTLFDHSSQMTWLLSADGLLLEANQAVLNYGDVEHEQIVGRPLADVIGWTLAYCGQGRLHAAIATAAGGEAVHYETTIRGANAREETFALTVRPIEQEAQPPMLMVEGVNVSDLKRLESHLSRCQRLESVGELTLGIVHDLTNLLTPIAAVADLLQIEFPEADSRQRKLLQILTANTSRAIALVKQLFHFAKGDTKRHRILEVDHLLLSVKQLIRMALPGSISMQTHVSADIWPIMGNENQLHQVLMNLCLNARDAMPNGGDLELSIENVEVDNIERGVELEDSPSEYVVIRVSDTGSGISPTVLNRIFEPFFTTKPAGRGSGLGLPTALAIVESHGGFIDVFSAGKLGTQCLVFLPAVV